ncbi:unnamed protein product [Caenorhabditis sp. 36 PRJEB53466]|nr:unnamed protein product [Caenorhabditis sp. 36 PRJEB53466]
MAKASKRRRVKEELKKTRKQPSSHRRHVQSKEKREATREKRSRSHSPANGTPRGSARRRAKSEEKPRKPKRKFGERMRKVKYTDCEWYWGLHTQMDAERYLADYNVGTFLVRSQPFKERTVILISIVTDNTEFAHLEIIPNGPKWELKDTTTRHETIVELVTHYRKHHIGNTNMILSSPAPKPGWLLSKKDILAPAGAQTLGAGNFGRVIIGSYQRRLVAIKFVTKNGLLVDRAELMREAMIMARLDCPYIVKMVGICLDAKAPMLLVEMLSCGLEKHLENHGKKTQFSEKLLWCWQLAKALKYLADMKIVHRDLAARNGIFNRYGILKLSDFGMSDDEDKVLIVATSKDQLPIRWLPPESVKPKEGKFNEKTDVWSFAVTCNEIFQNGEKPLQHVPSHTLLKRIRDYNGGPLHLVPTPKIVPQEVADFLYKCWDPNNEARPNFAAIFATIDTWIRLKFRPPPIKEWTVRLIRNCCPLRPIEYELLYNNEWDIVEPVKKVRKKKIKQFTRKRKRVKIGKDGKPIKKDLRKRIRKLKRRLRKKQKRRRMREKLRVWRVRRREERRKRNAMDEWNRQRHHLRIEPTRPRIRPKFEKLVTLYYDLMRFKWRKQAPTRETHLPLRQMRLINKQSTHPASRNGKAIRVIMSRVVRLKKPLFAKPVFPKIPKPIMQKKMSAKKRRTNPTSVLKQDRDKVRRLDPKEVAKKMELARNPKLLKRYKRKRKRILRKRRKRRLKRRIRRKGRKRIRGKRRQHRKRRRRRLYRRKKRNMRRKVLALEQKSKMRELYSRRLAKKQMIARRKRLKRIGMILINWRIIRRILLKKKVKRMLVQQEKRVLKKTKARIKSNEAQKMKQQTGTERGERSLAPTSIVKKASKRKKNKKQ